MKYDFNYSKLEKKRKTKKRKDEKQNREFLNRLLEGLR